MSRGPLLALETSGPTGSVALAVGSSVVGHRVLPVAREHAARLLPAVAGLLDDAGLSPRDLGAVVAGSGPGSFTGVRVAAATAKGMAHALGIPLYAISSLRAAALGGAEADRGPLGVLVDARGRRLFTGLYDRAAGRARALRPDRFLTLDEWLADPEVERVPVAGDGADRHADELRRAGRTILPAPSGVPTADALLRVVLSGDAEPVSDPSAWEPDYLRATGAERAAGPGGSTAMG